MAVKAIPGITDVALNNVQKSVEEPKDSNIRGETCVIRGTEYLIRYPKARDMIALEKMFQTKDATSPFTQALLMVQELAEDKSLTYEYLEDLYLDELTEVLELFRKLLPNL